jgi:hypothetical protein
MASRRAAAAVRLCWDENGKEVPHWDVLQVGLVALPVTSPVGDAPPEMQAPQEAKA